MLDLKQIINELTEWVVDWNNEDNPTNFVASHKDCGSIITGGCDTSKATVETLLNNMKAHNCG